MQANHNPRITHNAAMKQKSNDAIHILNFFFSYLLRLNSITQKRPWTKPQSSWFSLFLSWVQTKHQSIIARRCTRCSASCVSYCCDDMVYRRRLVRCLDKVCFMSFDHWVTIGPPANSIIAWTHRSCVRRNKWQIIFCWSGLTHRSSEKAPRMKCSVIGTNGMRSTQTVTTRYDLNHLHCYLTSLSFHKMQLQKGQTRPAIHTWC